MTTQVVASLDFKRFLIEEVERCWSTRHEPLLLSKLGQLAAARGFVLHQELGGRKLSQFIQQELADELEVQSPNDTGILLRAIPKNLLGAEAAPTFDNKPDGSPPAGLNRAFLSAFGRPIADGYERWVRIDPPIRYRDLPSDQRAADGYVQIERSFLISPAGDVEAFAQATKWLSAKGFEIQKFMLKAKTQARSDKSLLSQLIEGLTESELKRVSLPLDIVEKLMRK